MTVERGYTTTEFWGKTAIQLLTAAIAMFTAFGRSSIDLTQQAAILGMAGTMVSLLEGVYIVARNYRKKGAATVVEVPVATPAVDKPVPGVALRP